MRRFLLILLMALLPLQSFAVSYARLQMDSMTMTTMEQAMEQGAMPCHDEANSTTTDHDGCCKNTAACELMCGLSTAVVFSSVVKLHVPIAPEVHPDGLPTSFISAQLAQPIKPPIL